jgi:hypothetical protein
MKINPKQQELFGAAPMNVNVQESIAIEGKKIYLLLKGGIEANQSSVVVWRRYMLASTMVLRQLM